MKKYDPFSQAVVAVVYPTVQAAFLASAEGTASLAHHRPAFAPLAAERPLDVLDAILEVVHVAVSPEGRLKVLNVYAAVDCGDVVNLDSATAQVEGGIVFALSAALLSEITIKVHRGNVMKKMGARSLADLVRMADALGIRQAKH